MKLASYDDGAIDGQLYVVSAFALVLAIKT